VDNSTTRTAVESQGVAKIEVSRQIGSPESHNDSNEQTKDELWWMINDYHFFGALKTSVCSMILCPLIVTFPVFGQIHMHSENRAFNCLKRPFSQQLDKFHVGSITRRPEIWHL
jgi:hypothetical protein